MYLIDYGIASLDVLNLLGVNFRVKLGSETMRKVGSEKVNFIWSPVGSEKGSIERVFMDKDRS